MFWTILVFVVGIGILIYALNLMGLTHISISSVMGAKAVNKALSNQYYIKNGVVTFYPNGNFLGSEHQLKGADAESFVVLAYAHAKDKTQAYFQDSVIRGADAPSFKVFPGDEMVGNRYLICWFSRDKDQAYYRNRPIPGAQASTFMALWGYYCRDEHTLYYMGQKFVDSDSVAERVGNDHDKEYLRLDQKLFFKNKEMEGVDVENFLLLGDGFARDSKRVYYYEMPISGLDPSSFKRINEHFSRDEEHVFYHSDGLFRGLPNADPNSFRIINQEFSRDKDQVYHGSRILREIDVDNFNRKEADEMLNDPQRLLINYDDDHCAFIVRDKMVAMSSQYSIYNNEVYAGNTRVVNATVDGFTVFEQSDMYARDKQYVFYRAHTIANADRETFQVLNSSFAKDKNHVYFQDKRLVDIKPEGFEYKQGMYGEPIDADTATLVNGLEA